MDEKPKPLIDLPPELAELALALIVAFWTCWAVCNAMAIAAFYLDTALRPWDFSGWFVLGWLALAVVTGIVAALGDSKLLRIAFSLLAVGAVAAALANGVLEWYYAMEAF